MDTVKITFVNGTNRVITNTNYENIMNCALQNINFVIHGVTDTSQSVVYVVSNILTIEKVK
ncbi:hypothetical protein [Bacillus albus]|uniref:hypothetical protein n=1 Tax=Bacillus albus TaxID=2026189 RepID=UPI001020463A|nr:hypothetical protein [Bacillus albus]